MHTQYRFSLLPLFLITAIGFSLSACQQLQPPKKTTVTPTAKTEPKTQEQTQTKSSDVKKKAAPKNDMCVDVLALTNTKPAEMTFVGCNASFYDDAHRFMANYKVKGKDVLAVQEYLHKTSGMPRLVKDCCHWHTLNVATGQKNGMIEINNKRYYINMQSTELRLGWNIAADIEHISYFHVQVMHPLDK